MPQPRDLNLNELAKGLTGAAKDATYVAVGLGVLGMQKAQVQRLAIQKRLPEGLAMQKRLPEGLEARLGEVRAEVARHAEELDELVLGAMRRVESSLEPIEALLPAPVRDVAKLAHTGAHQVRIRVRELLAAP
ncbi:MAG TPA: hypothetical protein VMU76_07515 [Acidimicrobiales bacterium]|nr:hypothetical protein [Acidimicrobiales bacterium]